MTGITRPAKLTDAPQIIEVVNPYRVNTLYSFSEEPLTTSDMLNALCMNMAHGYPYFVYENDGEVVGVISGVPFTIDLDEEFINGPKDKMLEITIAVKPSHINNVAARCLHKALLEYAEQNDVHSIWAGVIKENRPVTVNIRMLGYKYITTLDKYGKKFGQDHDLKLFQKIIKKS